MDELVVTMYCCMMEGCGKMYPSKSNLTRHIKNKHLSLTRAICGDRYSTKLTLRKHAHVLRNKTISVQTAHASVKPAQVNSRDGEAQSQEK